MIMTQMQFGGDVLGDSAKVLSQATCPGMRPFGAGQRLTTVKVSRRR